MNGSNGTGALGVTTEADTERLRGSIQSVVQRAGPAGNSMESFLEDAGNMAAELRKWEEDARKYVYVSCSLMCVVIAATDLRLL